MRANTKKRKKATVMLKATQEQEWWADQVVQVMLHGKRALDAAMLDVGRLVAETLMYMEREERSGPDYHPTSSGLMKWASQRGSIYVGDQKLCVEHPRLRGALLHGPEQIAEPPAPVAVSPGAVCIRHPERGHLVEDLASNSVFNSLPRQRSSPHLGTDDRLVAIDCVLHHASLGAA